MLLRYKAERMNLLYVGHGEVSAGGEQDDEEGDPGGSLHHDGLLHAVRLPRLLALILTCVVPSAAESRGCYERGVR